MDGEGTSPFFGLSRRILRLSMYCVFRFLPSDHLGSVAATSNAVGQSRILAEKFGNTKPRSGKFGAGEFSCIST